jgi:hypothetical protein
MGTNSIRMRRKVMFELFWIMVVVLVGFFGFTLYESAE